MDQIVFMSSISLFILISIIWGYKKLPEEKWQFMAVVPRHKTDQKKWRGLNLTYYGFICANAYVFAVAILLILSASTDVSITSMCVLIAGILVICLPASKLVAQIVEKKQGTLTVGGAVFIGTIITPLLVFVVNQTLGRIQGFEMSVTVFLASVSIAYAYGEGLGRLACISFGCCYGKPLSQCSPFIQKLFSKFNLVYSGKTKKISYASGLDEQKTIPIQIITAILYSGCALIGTWLYLNTYFTSSLILTMTVTQFWRFLSEFFRADFRGKLKITPYQIMALICVLYSIGITIFFKQPTIVPELSTAMETLWNPWILLFIQCIWVITFIHTGRSVVTGSELSFHVVKDKI